MDVAKTIGDFENKIPQGKIEHLQLDETLDND
jgi:hypothetical protein